MRETMAKQPKLLALLVLLVMAQACQSVSTSNDPVSEEPVTTTDSTLDSSGIGNSSTWDDRYAEKVTQRPQDLAGPAYLEGTVAPCVPIDRSAIDPCEPGMPTDVEHVLQSSSEELMDPMPTIADLLLGKWIQNEPAYPALAPHLVIRGTVRPDSFRCDDYQSRPPGFTNQNLRDNARPLVHVHCFADLRVNEYLVGEGPPELTVSLHRESVHVPTGDGYREEFILKYGGEDEWVDKVLKFPAQRTAAVYEGKELVLFLGIPAITLEAWDTAGLMAVWFVQRTDDNPPRAVSKHIWLAFTAEQRARLDMPLAELERQVRSASANRIAVTGGRIGKAPDLPMLVTDANDLRTYYEDPSVGVSYETDAPALPPPAPGEEELPGPAGNTGGGTTPNSTPTPGDETRPSPGDDDQPPNSVP